MAQHYSPRIVQDGLVMCLDASQNKSYPTTDLPVKGELLLWLDAADDTTFSYSSGTEVSQWRDKSGNNNHASQSTVANQPTRSTFVNSRKSVNFQSANGDRLRIPSGIVTPSYVTAIVAIKPGTQSYNYAVILDQDHSYSGGYSGWVIQRNNNASQWLSWVANGAGNNWLNPNGISYSDNTPQIVTLRKSSSTLTLYSSGTGSADVSISDQSINQLSYFGLNIGYWRAGVDIYSDFRYFNGEICEILVYNRALSATELKQVHTYLGQKWGVSNTDRSIIDLSGNDDSGLLGGGAAANMPVYDFYNKGSLRFDGLNDTVNINNSQLNISTSITVEAWVKYNAQGGATARAYSVITYKSGWGWLLEDQSGQFNFRISTSVNGDSNVNSSYSHGLNNWNHVVGTYDGSSQKIYVDGILKNSTSLTGTINVAGNTVRLGNYEGDYNLTGNIGVVRVYNKALSAAEVAQNYEAQKSKFANTIVQQGLVLNLDAGNPYSYAGAGSTWYDVSGNGKDFTLDGSGITYNSGGYFSLADGAATRSTSITSSTTCTVVVWIRTTDTQSLIFRGNSNSYYLAAYYVGQGFYSDNCGIPTYWIDTVSVSNPNPTYLDGNWHMWEMKNVNFSGWTTFEFNKYPGFTFGNGAVGQIMIYDRNLSAAESLQIYNATKSRYGL